MSFRPPPEAHSGVRCASRRPVSCASFRPGLGVVNTLRRHSEASPRRIGAPCGRLARARTSWPRVRPPKRRLEPLQSRLSSATFHRVAQPCCTNRADHPADRPARPFCTTVLAVVPTTFSSTLGTHDDASRSTAPRGGGCWLRDCVPSCPRLSMYKRRLFTEQCHRAGS